MVLAKGKGDRKPFLLHHQIYSFQLSEDETFESGSKV